MMAPRFALLSAAVLMAVPTLAETVKDREGAVRGDKAAMEGDARWLYNEVDQGFGEARRTGKPLLVVIRCVPCLACMGIDASVLKSEVLAPLLDQFVCVRVINANALDLHRFQFDYDLSFSTLFFNGDGTVYGRFGSWSHQKNPQETDIAGFKRALEGALAIHAGYPGNRESLAGKQGVPTPFRLPVEIPSLAGRYQRDLDWNGKVVASCVHCHQIGDAFRAHYRDHGEAIPAQWIYPQPAPETIGLKLAADRPTLIQTVVPGSPAARSGFHDGDSLVSLDGQPLVSVADVAWILHRSPEPATIAAVVERARTQVPLTLQLPADWRYHTDISKRVGTWGMRGMATGGLVLTDLTDEQRATRQLSEDAMGLLVTFVGLYGKHAAAKNSGFRKDDVIVALDGRTARITEGELLGRLLHDHRPGQTVEATVLRGHEQLKLTLPMQ